MTFALVWRRLERVKAEAATLEAELPALSSARVGAWSRRAVKAFAIEGVYTGIEAILKLLAEEIDGQLPRGSDWHALLLEMAAEPRPGVRPAMISERTRALLDQLRRFRHVARHNYALDLDDDAVERSLEAMRAVLPAFEADLSAFEAAMTASST